VAALVAFFIYRQLGALDVQIEGLKVANNDKQKGVKAADVSVARTELVDKYLDGDVNWLNEIRRLASKVPESDKLIVRSVSAVSDTRNGGGTMTIEGAVTKPAVIEEFEDAIRDDFRMVQGDGASELRTSDQYRWSFTESIQIDPGHIRDQRYIGIREVFDQVDSDPDEADKDSEQDVAEKEGAEQSAVASGTNSEDPVTPDDDAPEGVLESEESPSVDTEKGAAEAESGQATGESDKGDGEDSGEDSPDSENPPPEPS